MMMMTMMDSDDNDDDDDDDKCCFGKSGDAQTTSKVVRQGEKYWSVRLITSTSSSSSSLPS